MKRIDFPPVSPQTAATQLRAKEFLPPEGTSWPPMAARKAFERKTPKKWAEAHALAESAVNFGVAVG